MQVFLSNKIKYAPAGVSSWAIKRDSCIYTKLAKGLLEFNSRRRKSVRKKI